jgi:uncharacterized membrane protein
MKLTRNKIFLGILAFGLIANLLVYFDVQYLYLRAIFSFVFLTIIPGLLIMIMLKIRKIGFWEYLVYTIGLSITFLMFGGLLINWVLPIMGIAKPLSLYPLMICLNPLLLTMWVIAYLRNKDILYEIKFANLSLLNWIFFIAPIVFPILSILGAISLNNRGSNIFTMMMLGGIVIYVFLIVIFRSKLNAHIFPLAVILTSVSLLTMFSLRSWHIVGWDINLEYLVFTLTNITKHWYVNTLNNAYNLCVSITILPTIFTSFLNINNEYIYKLIFPILFSVSPLIIYLFTKKLLSKSYAFLSSFFFMIQIFFIEQMPALARQEVALIFFSLVFMLIFDQVINKVAKNVLLVIFGLSIVLSHYSTTYIWIAIMIIYYLLSYIFKKITFKNLKQYFTLKYILVIIIFTFVWESQLVAATSDFTNFVKGAIASISKGLSSDMINGGVNRLVFGNLNINNINNVTKNYKDMTKIYQNMDLSLYTKEKYRDYLPKPVSSKESTALFKGKISSIMLSILKVNKLLLVDILPFVGIVYLTIKYFSNVNENKNNSSWVANNINYLLITISTLPLMLLIIILPIIKISYNMPRLYIQSLIILAPLTILGGAFLLSIIKLNKLVNITLISLLVLFFLYSSGVFYQIAGGPSFLHLNNFGELYDLYYITGSEIKSAEWLAKNIKENNSTIYADEAAGLRLTSFAQTISYTYDILPSTIDISSYVYLNRTNVQMNKVYKRYDSDNFLEFTAPIKFLNENKNLLYNNGDSEVFK